jgi:hypothetical protein
VRQQRSLIHPIETFVEAKGEMDMPVDPVTIMTTISLGLKLVDQFREQALRFLSRQVQPPTATAEQAGNTFQIKHNGTVTQRIAAGEMNLSEWDEVRVLALNRRIKINWDLFNELFSEEPLLATDERARIKARMARMQDELCEDFREMVRIYERTLGTGLPDHYALYEVCGNP